MSDCRRISSTVCCEVTERSQVGEARRLAAAWAEVEGLSQDQRGRMALLISELAGNLINHTRDGGSILFRMLEAPEEDTLEVLCLDRGPGTTNFNSFLQDGFSTAGTAGTGLGAVRRASDLFEVHSQPEVGTAVLCQIRGANGAAPLHGVRFGMVNVPKKGEDICGDACGCCQLADGRVRVMVADGLGHGHLAADASRAALSVFRAHPNVDLPSLLDKVHWVLRATRGAAVSVAEVDPAAALIRYAGAGNIAGVIVRPNAESDHMVSMNGTLGMVQPRLQEFTYPWTDGCLLVMSSDGLKNHWRLDRYAGLMNRHPSLIAATLFRDHSRHTDDTTVAVLSFES